MNYVLDSNVLLRMAQDTHPMHAAATQATITLIRQGDTIHVIPQNLYEFWSVATREIKYNGLGLSVGDAQNELARLRSLFSYLPDTPAVCSQWERLIVQYAVIGRDSHDTSGIEMPSIKMPVDPQKIPLIEWRMAATFPRASTATTPAEWLLPPLFGLAAEITFCQAGR